MGSKVLLALLCLLLVVSAPGAHAQELFFNPNFLLSDEELQDSTALTLQGVQRFLEEQGSGLAHRSFTDYQGIVRPASEIIWLAAQESQINPKVLLTTLQKEQSLINDPAPTQRQLDRAMGYRCPDNGSCHPNTLDFGKQVDGAAWQFRQYLDHPQDWFFKPGLVYWVDEQYIIIPTNIATAGFYNYTPHYSGNLRFWGLWSKYWSREYPDGTLLKAHDNPDVWLIQYGTRRLITSYSVLLSRFDPGRIIIVNASDIDHYPVGLSIQFSNYSILRTADGQRYLVVDDQIRPIVDDAAFRKLGYNPEEIIDVEAGELVGYTPGVNISVDSLYPTGVLLQNKTTGGVYYVDNGVRYPIIAREILRTRFPRLHMEQVEPVALDQYPEGFPVLFRDGELVRAANDAKIYVISGGLRRWIPSELVFTNLGYRWENVITTSQQALDLHPLGDVLNF